MSHEEQSEETSSTIQELVCTRARARRMCPTHPIT